VWFCWSFGNTFASLLLNRSHERTQVSEVRCENMPSIACNLNELFHAYSFANTHGENLHTHIA